jgi:peptide/nickel transport system substrate-binding protein
MFYEGHPKITGIPGRQSNTAQNWLGDTYDSFTDYGVASSMTDQAASILEAADYSRQDGQWVQPNGEAIPSFTVKAPSDWSWARAGQTIATQL